MRRLGLAGCAVAAWVLSWLVPAPAHAAGLLWAAPRECPTRAEIEAAIERTIGGPLSRVHGVDFEGTVDRTPGGGFRLRLRTIARSPDAEARSRELGGASCGEVSDAAVLSIALTITGLAAARSGSGHGAVPIESDAPAPPGAAGEARDRAPPAAPGELQPAAAPPPAGASEAPPSAPRPQLEVSAAAVLMLDSAFLPGVGVGPSLEVSVRYGLFELIALGALFAEHEARLSGGGGGRFGLALFGALLCLQPSAEVVSMQGCAGFELGELSATGVDLDEERPDTAPLRALRADLGAGYRILPRFGVFARVGVSAPLTSAEFVVEKARVQHRVHRLGPMSARALVGLELFL